MDQVWLLSKCLYCTTPKATACKTLLPVHLLACMLGTEQTSVLTLAKTTRFRIMLDIPAVRSDQLRTIFANFDNVNCLPSAGGAANPAAGVPAGHRAGHRLLVAVPARQVRISRDTYIACFSRHIHYKSDLPHVPASNFSILTRQCSQISKKSSRNGTFLTSAPLTKMHCHLHLEQPSLLSSIPHHPRAAVCAVATRITLGGCVDGVRQCLRVGLAR